MEAHGTYGNLGRSAPMDHNRVESQVGFPDEETSGRRDGAQPRTV